MPSPEHVRLEELFSAALQLSSSGERSRYLSEACADDNLLRTRIEELLSAHDRAGPFLEIPVMDPDATLHRNAGDAPTTEREIGPYRLLSEIGAGGFGVVYLAQQEHPVRRQVALKILKQDVDPRQVMSRFALERQTLALMDHPHIARVLDAGITPGGRPYFVMELVRGIPITRYCEQHRLELRQRLELFAAVCYAVQHAHQKGVIHRDIKPGNVLVTVDEDRPVPKVIDFGIARAIVPPLDDGQSASDRRLFVGTPQYMSPDQADIGGLDLDTRSDIYSMGILLYELLTGTTPFAFEQLRGARLEEIRRRLREEDPPWPSKRLRSLDDGGAAFAAHLRSDARTLLHGLRGDLDWIVMKALDKDRTRRYASASELARDIERHFRHEPVLASPPNIPYRVAKFVRRNRAVVLAAAVIGFAWMAGLFFALSGYHEATRAKEAIQAERDVAERALVDVQRARAAELEHRQQAEEQAARATSMSEFLRDMLAAVSPIRVQGREVTVRYLLDEAARKLEAGALRGQPEVEASVRLMLAETYDALGAYAAAETQIRTALDAQTRLLGAEAAETLRSRTRMAGVLNSQLRYADAEREAQAALAVQQDMFGDDQPDVLTTRLCLAIALSGQGKLVPAERELTRTIAAARRVFGEEAIETQRCLVELASVYRDQARFDLAESVLRPALIAERRLLGPEHPDVTRAATCLAQVLEARGDLASAEQLFRECWEVDRRVLGADHPRAQIPLNHLIRVLRSQGKTEDLRPFLVQRIERLRRAAERPEATPQALHAYAWELLTCELPELRSPSDALPVAVRAVTLDGEQDANLLETLALAYRSSGNLPQAVLTQRKALDQARRGGPYDVPEMEERLMTFMVESGRLVEAAWVRYGGVAEEMAGSIVGEYSSVGADLLSQAEDRILAGDHAAAEPLLRACLTMRQKSLPAGHWAISDVQSRIGATLAAQGRFQEAEPNLLEAFERLSSDATAPAQVVDASRRRILGFYQTWGRPDLLQSWQAKHAAPPAPTSQPAE